MKNLYTILNVRYDASASEIKKAYHKLVKKYHPDLNQGLSQEKLSDYSQKLQEVILAYNVLSDEAKRAEYDNSCFSNVSVSESSCGRERKKTVGDRCFYFTFWTMVINIVISVFIPKYIKLSYHVLLLLIMISAMIYFDRNLRNIFSSVCSSVVKKVKIFFLNFEKGWA